MLICNVEDKNKCKLNLIKDNEMSNIITRSLWDKQTQIIGELSISV